MTLREYLASKKISETDFAELIGTSQAAVHRYCKGVRMPKPSIMDKIIAKTGGKVTAGDFYASRAAQ